MIKNHLVASHHNADPIYRLLHSSLFLICFILYFRTMCSDVFPGANHGELISVGTTLGIPHPTGYPFWSLLAHGSTWIPFGSCASRIHVLMALIASFGVTIVFKILWHFRIPVSVCFFMSISMAFDLLYWQQATAAEVYGLHILLCSLLLFFLLAYRDSLDYRWFYLSCFLLGIMFANHLLSVFMIPFLIIISHRPLNKNLTIQVMIHGLSFSILGISLYLYLPIRAAVDPAFMWFDPSHCREFWQHLTGSQFHEQMLSGSWPKIAARLSLFPTILISDLHYIIWPLSVIGIFTLLHIDRPFALASFLSFISLGVFAIGYDIHDIDSYFLPLEWFSVILAGIGIHLILSNFHRHSFNIGIILLFSTLTITHVGRCYKLADRSFNHLARDYGKSLLLSTPPDSILYYQGDNSTNSLTYLLTVEKYRSDLTLQDLNMNVKPLGVSSSNTNRPIVRTFRENKDKKEFYPNGVVYIKRNDTVMPAPDETILSKFQGMENPQEQFWEPSSREIIVEFLINRAEFEAERGEWSQARQYYAFASQLAEQQPQLIEFISILMASRGLLTDAVKLEETLLNTNPPRPSLFNNLAFHYFILGERLSFAANLAQRAVDSDKENANFHRTLGKILIVTGQFDQARVILERFKATNRDLLTELDKISNLSINPILSHSSDPEELANISETELNELLKQGAWNISRLILQSRILNGESDTDYIEHYLTTSKYCDTPSGIIHTFETAFSKYSSPSLLKLLFKLHLEAGNHSRVKDIRFLLDDIEKEQKDVSTSE